MRSRRLLVALLALALLPTAPAVASARSDSTRAAAQNLRLKNRFQALRRRHRRTTRRRVVTRRPVRPMPVTATPPAAAPAQATTCANTRIVPGPDTVGLARDAVLCLVNNARAAAGLSALNVQPQLEGAALTHSIDMVLRGYFEHTSPEGIGLRERLLAASYVALNRAWRIGETIAWGTGPFATPASTVARWMASPPHRENLLGPSFRDAGVGIAPGVPRPDGNDGATYTIDFGVRS
jgi:uncharacterized protein YkwD